MSPSQALIRLSYALTLLALCAAPAVQATPGSGGYLDALSAEAARGKAEAQLELAIKYEYGEGVPQDLARARRLLCDAAKQGDPEAQYQLGWLYANGRGVAHDDRVAALLFELAAKQGHVYAANMLQYVHPGPDTPLPQCLRPASNVEADALDFEAGAGERAPIEALVYRLAPQYGVDPKLALAVIAVESGFNAGAVSPKNARGLMQLIPQTAERFRVKSVFDPVQNVRGGLAYLRWLLAYFRGNVALVIAAYNAGERAVDKYRGIPPYRETRDYVAKITRVYKKQTASFDPAIVEPSPLVRRERYAER